MRENFSVEPWLMIGSGVDMVRFGNSGGIHLLWLAP
jgi:hypothetical protein